MTERLVLRWRRPPGGAARPGKEAPLARSDSSHAPEDRARARRAAPGRRPLPPLGAASEQLQHDRVLPGVPLPGLRALSARRGVAARGVRGPWRGRRRGEWRHAGARGPGARRLASREAPGRLRLRPARGPDYLSSGRGETSAGVEEPEGFNEPRLFLVQRDRVLFCAAVQSMPFARPRFEESLKGVAFAFARPCPASGKVLQLEPTRGSA